ncbi:MAG TPA: hypothetical protein VF211_02415 [Burkholderiales bacterium]
MPLAKETWQGASYDDAVRAWGEPVRSAKLPDGRESHTWVSEQRRARGSFYPSIGVGVGGGSGNVGVGVGIGGIYAPVGEDVQRCERTLVFSDGRVVDQTWTGNESYCATLRR